MAATEAPGEKIEPGQLLGEAEARFTEIVDYGVSMEEAMSGKPLPATGIRFDLGFEGTMTGLIEGTISGVGYLYVRADGVQETHTHARLITKDGARVAIFQTGAVSVDESGHMREVDQVRLHSNFERYQWVNGLALRGEGTVDMGTGTMQMRSYAA